MTASPQKKTTPPAAEGPGGLVPAHVLDIVALLSVVLTIIALVPLFWPN